MKKLEDLVKVSLDELRMQMLGTQVLFGFQLQGVFQDGFGQASRIAKLADFGALCLVILTLGLLIAAPCQHRLVDRGNATRRIFGVAKRFAEWALLPFAVSIALDVFVVFDHYWPIYALPIAIVVGTLAIGLWYGLGAAIRSTIAKEERCRMPRETDTDLHAKVDQMLTEARVVLPGAQALLGFQFVVTMTKMFGQLPAVAQNVHLLALGAVVLTIMLLITPAAVHRLAFGGEDSLRFHRIGSLLVTGALIPLALGIVGDFYVASSRMLETQTSAAATAASALFVLLSLWYILPVWLRKR